MTVDAPIPTLEEKVAFLSRPGTLADAAWRVETRQTHMSWVFLAGRKAWKLKKPVRYEFLDFSTIEARRRDCEEEVRLNRRLAPEIYLGTVPLTLSAEGTLALGGRGRVVDWLVEMVRLPEERMLDRAIVEHRLDPRDVRAVAKKLSRFYLDAPRVTISPVEYRRRFEHDLRDDRDALRERRFALPPDAVERAFAGSFLFLAESPGILDARAREGRVVEAHGDLRPEHVCLLAEPLVIDALEFKRDFRLLDPADELAFLALECERLGAPSIRDVLFATWRAESGDDPPLALLDFYAAARATLRAKLAVWHLRDTGLPEPERWIDGAMQYLRLAARHGARLETRGAQTSSSSVSDPPL